MDMNIKLDNILTASTSVKRKQSFLIIPRRIGDFMEYKQYRCVDCILAKQMDFLTEQKRIKGDEFSAYAATPELALEFKLLLAPEIEMKLREFDGFDNSILTKIRANVPSDKHSSIADLANENDALKQQMIAMQQAISDMQAESSPKKSSPKKKVTDVKQEEK